MNTLVKNERTLLKEFKIETKGKSKMLSIFHGNILRDTSDIIGISVYDQEENKGDLYKGFQEQFLIHTNYTLERKLLADGENAWTGVSTSIDQQQHIVYIHSTSKEGDAIQGDSLRSILKMTFATLSSYIYEGNKIHTVALPVLFRKGIKNSDYTHFIHLFVYESTKFLRKNPTVESLNLYIWHAEDAYNWLNVLNENLQLSTEKDVNTQTIVSLKQEILSKIKQPCFKSLLPDWFPGKAQYQLTKRDLDKWQLANIGDRLINVIVDVLSDLPIMPDELKNLGTFKRILKIKSQRLLVEWLADYLLSIKIYKNYVKDYSPSKLDEYHYLLQLSQVLKAFEPLLQKEKSVEHK